MKDYIDSYKIGLWEEYNFRFLLADCTTAFREVVRRQKLKNSSDVSELKFLEHCKELYDLAFLLKVYLDIKQYNSDGTKRSYNERSSEFKKTYNEIKEQLEDVLLIDFDYPSSYDLNVYDKNSSMRID